jgi:predicted ATPase/class 3 adenylate cyclase
MAMIATPDQRVRVFISSTMKELSAERSAVRKSVERLRLTPVLFELGARAHPPRELYLSYLRQSHVFLGIYHEQYGWIAPGKTISGLEDEFLASTGKPKLIYVKSPAPNRDARLAEMLQRIASEGLSYRPFRTVSELAKLVVDDLAVLLSERFGPADGSDHHEPAADASDVPDRRETTTFLFTDVEGSTRLLQQAGSAYAGLLGDHRRLLRAAFVAHRGREVDTQGDSFFVAFPSPVQAIAATIDAQRALTAYQWPEPFRVRVRMGLHTGEAAVLSDGYVGVAVHRAARIASAAHGGQVLLSGATAALVCDDLPDGAALRDLGDHRLKDFDRPVRLYQLDVSGLPVEFPPVRASVRRRVPELPGSFVGRQAEVEAVAALLRDRRTRLVTLTGAGGVGKTRLAIEASSAVAGDMPGGVVFVPLSAVTDPALVLRSVADALGTRSEAGLSPLDAVDGMLGDDRLLLLLDNMEQVASSARELVALLDRVPSLVALVTSRQLLRVRSEIPVPVRPLEGSAAVQLFLDRAVVTRPGFPSVEDRDAVTEICRRLDGLPLAIELAAARARLLPPAALLSRLRERLDVLSGGPVDLPARQRTLRATMDWSHELLSPTQQAMFARLGVFSGGWSLDAAEHVCGGDGEPDVLETLAGLLDASLVVSEAAGDEARFGMLETVRAYAAERLTVAQDRAETVRRHGAWILTLTGDLMRTRGRDYRLAAERVDREWANLRAAARRMLDGGDVASLALLVRNGIGHLALRDATVEAVGWLDEALELAGTARPSLRGRLLVLRAVFGVATGDLSRMPAWVAEGEPLLPDDAEHELDHALAAVARIQEGAERGLEHAIEAVDVALARFTSLGLELGQAAMHQARAEMALAMGDPARAEASYRRAAQVAESMGEDAMLGPVLSLLGLSQLAQDNVEGARRSVLEGARVNRQAGLPTNIAYSLEGMAALALAEARPAVAARSLAAATAARGRTALPLTPTLPPLIEQLVARSRAMLGEEEFEHAWAEGQSLSLVEALDRTLQAWETTSVGAPSHAER